ncbi:MAG: ImmA/IrrE family metallo-endopeptidase [Turicibacter sp.]|nr:ImmA/IrrE family metallo-endopeptidase [Turicibacter sp.]
MAGRFEAIDKKVDALVKKHGTRDPFQLAEAMGIRLIEHELGEIYGFYLQEYRIKLIFLNKNLTESKLRYTCAHELGHAVLHPDENTPKLFGISQNLELMVEAEANYFMLKLLIDGSHKEEYLDTMEKILNYYGLPRELEGLLKRLPDTIL